MTTALLHSVNEGFARIGVGRSTGYQLIREGKLRVVKIGRRTLIAEEELQRYVRTLTDQGVA